MSKQQCFMFVFFKSRGSRRTRATFSTLRFSPFFPGKICELRRAEFLLALLGHGAMAAMRAGAAPGVGIGWVAWGLGGVMVRPPRCIRISRASYSDCVTCGRVLGLETLESH